MGVNLLPANVWSFANYNLSVVSPVGPIVVTGVGEDEVFSWERAVDETEHFVGADGGVVVTTVLNNTGVLKVIVHQESIFVRYMENLQNVNRVTPGLSNFLTFTGVKIGSLNEPSITWLSCTLQKAPVIAFGKAITMREYNFLVANFVEV